jgi:hypothetical protein
MKIEAINANAPFDHTVLAAVIARRWREDRHFYMPGARTHGLRLEALWWRQRATTALELHWSRGRPGIPSGELLPPMQGKSFEGAA